MKPCRRIKFSYIEYVSKIHFCQTTGNALCKQFAIIQAFVQYYTRVQPDLKKVQPDLKSGCCHTHFFDALVHVHKNQSLIV